MTHPIKARLYVSDDLIAGTSLALTEPQAHYLKNVLRLEPGALVALFNGRDGEWTGRIDGFAKRPGTVTILEQGRPQKSEPDLWLLFAPLKRARIDFLVEKATELGVSHLCPVVTQRTIAERVNLERLRAHAIEAAEQTERLSVPIVAAPAPLDDVIARWPAGRRLLLCDESGSAPPIAAVLQESRAEAWAVLVGPEGGFAETELDALRKLAFVSPVSLGPRVLRADTAAVAALAVLQALAGDWHTPRRG
ncbi:MAG TPA: 16S rRNA (uracil(1498)-N(3))-methyltransferase [Stellaceae bacterium]|nr:16S rRNA (uracil(1498)-N(3))-methyltransferase [Stellaceae bacterium]